MRGDGENDKLFTLGFEKRAVLLGYWLKQRHKNGNWELNRNVEFVGGQLVICTALLPQTFRCILGKITEFKTLTLAGSPLMPGTKQ